MRTLLRISARICVFTIFVSANFSSHLRTTDCKQSGHLFSKFAPHLEGFDHFQQKITKNLTQDLIDLKLLPIGADLSKLLQTYLMDFCQSIGNCQIQDGIGREQTGASKNPICTSRIIKRTFRLFLEKLSPHSKFLSNFASLKREMFSFFWSKERPFLKDNQIATEKRLTLKRVYNLKDQKYLPVPNIVSNMVEEIPLPKYPFDDPEILAKYSFVSPRGLKALVQFEWSLYPRIKYTYYEHRNQTKGTFREEFDKKNMDVRKYLTEFEDFTIKLLGGLDHITNRDIKMIESVALNLLAAYKTVARFMDYMQTWYRRKKQYTNNLLMSRITSYMENVYKLTHGPTQADLEAAMFGVWYTQFTQKLEIKDVRVLKPFPTVLPAMIRKFPLFVNGIVGGKDTRVNLNARDCLKFAKHSATFSFTTPSLLWVEQAFNLVNNTTDDSVTYKEAQDALASRQSHYECRVKPQNITCHDNNLRNKLMTREAKKDLTQVKFWSMCKGKTSQTERERAALFCWYEREFHPSYKIAPIKAEWLSLHPKPEVVRFHDILSDRVMDALTNYSYENERRDGIVTEDKTFRVEPLKCQLAYAIAFPYSNEAAIHVSKSAARFTGLKLSTRTPLRISGYGPGSHAKSHFDLNVFATVLFYLTDAEKGGETSFEGAGVVFVPKRGSAIFWFSLRTDGSEDKDTDHGSCPIILGEKWLTVRWFANNSQDHLKCDLKPNTRFEILVNGKSKYK